METITLLLAIFIGWIISQWKEILIVFFIFLLIKIFKDNLSVYEKKLADIDYNVKQIAEKVGVYDDSDNTNTPAHKKTFTQIYKELKDERKR